MRIIKKWRGKSAPFLGGELIDFFQHNIFILFSAMGACFIFYCSVEV